MIRHIVRAALLASAMHATSCVAGDAPLLAPSREVTVLYRLSGSSAINGAEKLQVSYGTDGRTRLDFFRYPEAKTPFGSLLYDPPADLVTTVLPEQQGYMERDVGKLPSPGSFLSAAMQFTRVDDVTIGGVKCTAWQITSGKDYQGSACVTQDGVVIRATRDKPTKGVVEALAVQYGPLPQDAFLPPAGFKLIHNPAFPRERPLVPESPKPKP